MRYIPTSASTVEALKKQAKKLQRNGGGKHADLLDRVARGAGYDHWHHVSLCHKKFESQQGVDALEAECELIVRAAVGGVDKIIVTGPQVLTIPLVLFAGQGDAWLLEPEDSLVLCLRFAGQTMTRDFRDTTQQIEIGWDGTFRLDGDSFVVETEHELVGNRAIIGYPVTQLRPHLDRARSVPKRFDEIFGQVDAVDLTPDVIDRLVAQGWLRKTLEDAAREGARYSPSRDTVLTTPFAGGFGSNGDVDDGVGLESVKV